MSIETLAWLILAFGMLAVLQYAIIVAVEAVSWWRARRAMHRGPSVVYAHKKGALLGPGSGITTSEQANRVVNALRDKHNHCTCAYSTECCYCKDNK